MDCPASTDKSQPHLPALMSLLMEHRLPMKMRSLCIYAEALRTRCLPWKWEWLRTVFFKCAVDAVQDFSLPLACVMGACAFEAYNVPYETHGIKQVDADGAEVVYMDRDFLSSIVKGVMQVTWSVFSSNYIHTTNSMGSSMPRIQEVTHA